jgi:putative ubiquitin-RnfH superfamily antitoxin RatB of RatAB toxin-antitoxin module
MVVERNASSQDLNAGSNAGANQDSTINVEVVYARQGGQTLLQVKGCPGLTAAEAIERSGILVMRPEIDLAVNKLGIFGKPIKADQSLADGDRVEIYTPLIADPKQAKKKQTASRAGKEPPQEPVRPPAQEPVRPPDQEPEKESAVAD